MLSILAKVNDIVLDDFLLMVNGKPLERCNSEGVPLKLYTDYRIRGGEVGFIYNRT